VWEVMPKRPTDESAVRNANGTYLGRLVPLSRAIRLADDCRSLMLANGLEYAPYAVWREPTATIVIRKVKGEDQRVVLRASVERAMWRELHALTVKAVSENTSGGPAALQNISDEKEFDLWVGSLVADQAKPVDATESVFHVPAAMLTETSQRVYGDGVGHADRMAFLLRRAVSVYHKELGDDLDRREMRERRQQVQEKATSQFWTDVEQAVPHLLEATAAPGRHGLNSEWHRTPWGRSVRRAARAAYERTCPHETSRQIQAYALGQKALFAAPAEQSGVRTKKGD